MGVYWRGMNKTQLRKKVQGILAKKMLSQEFESPLVSDLILEKHYYCSLHGLRPIKFRKSKRNGPGYDFHGLFDKGWHTVSWSQCITPKRDVDHVKDALRLAIAQDVAAYRRDHGICERCQQRVSTEVDHVSPEFEEMAQKALKALDDDGWNEVWMNFDWWDEEAFRLPPDSPALRQFLDDHENARLMAVCHECHLQNSADRRRKRS